MKNLRLSGALVAALAWTMIAQDAARAEEKDVFDRVEHHYVDNNGVKLHYVTLGEGPVVLFLHGFPDFWYSWRHQMDELSSDFKCVAMDLRAYNLSDKPEGVENYTMEILLSDVMAVAKDTGASEITLVGHDWGGAIAWRFAMMNQDLVRRLIICNLTHPNGYLTVRKNATEEQKKNTQYIEDFQKPDAAKRFNPAMLAMISAGPGKDVRKRFVEAFENSYIDGMLNYYRAIWPMLSGDVEEEIPDLNMPVLQFHGLKDTAVDKDGLRDTWNWITEDYTLVTAPKSGHWVQRDADELVSATMKWWLMSRK